MKRRNFLAAAPAALLPMPTIAATEHPNDTVRRLGKEIQRALQDPAYIGFENALITSDKTAYFEEEDPHTRMHYLMGKLADVMPDCMNGGFRAIVNPDGTYWLQAVDRPLPPRGKGTIRF